MDGISKLIIDVSYHNGVINWEKVKASGCAGAILRCGYGDDIASQDDKQWIRNLSECERLGIPVGVYKEDPVVVDGNVVTSRGVGTAIAFALKLIEVLISKEKAEEIAASIIYSA